jgi:hypothetical protein
MLINTFADGARAKALTFTSNGERTVHFKIPDKTIVKSARLEIEGHPLSDRTIKRIGLVTICSLDDLNIFEDRMEIICIKKNIQKPGWGFKLQKPDQDLHLNKGNESEECYAVIPIDPGILAEATPGYFDREFDLVIIPDGKLNFNLNNLIKSGVAILTMNPDVAIELGLGSEITLTAGLNSLRVKDSKSIITNELRTEFIYLEDPQESGRAKKNQSGNLKSKNYFNIIGIKPVHGNCKVIIDTGVEDQGIVILDMRNKYIYFGFTEMSQMIKDPHLFSLLDHAIKWSGVGGKLTNIGYDVGKLSSGWTRLGEFEDFVISPDFSKLIREYFEIGSTVPGLEGSNLIPLTFYSDSPGILKINEVRINCAFIRHIATFADGISGKTIEFNGIDLQHKIMIEIPKNAKVRKAKVKIRNKLTNERVGVNCVNENNIHCLMISNEYIAAQEVIVDRYLPITRISLNLAKIKEDTELKFEIWSLNDNLNNDKLVVAQNKVYKIEGNVLGDLFTSAVIGASDLKDTYSWVDINIDKIILKPGTSYWLILRSIKGQAYWHANIQCPLGGLLRSSLDNGKKWHNHNMDGLLKIYFETDLLEPELLINSGSNDYENEIESEEIELRSNETHIMKSGSGLRIIYLTDFLNNNLSKYKLKNSKNCHIPLTISSECIGFIDIFDLDIECEVPSLETGTNENSISKQFENILQYIDEINVLVNNIHSQLPSDILKKNI